MAKAARTTTTPKSNKGDPTLAALKHHRKLRRTWVDTEQAKEEGRACQCEVARAIEAEERAAWRLAKTKPTTVAGASALLNYIVDEPAVGMFELGETSWHETAFRTVAAALKKIAHAR
jgi:hypothetical protein